MTISDGFKTRRQVEADEARLWGRVTAMTRVYRTAAMALMVLAALASAGALVVSVGLIGLWATDPAGRMGLDGSGLIGGAAELVLAAVLFAGLVAIWRTADADGVS